MHIINKILPDACYPNRDLQELGGFVIHYISAKNVDYTNRYDPDTVWNLLVELNMPSMRGNLIDPKTVPNKQIWASANFMIDRDGNIYRLVPQGRVAWHAGPSIWRGKRKCNEWTIGIEMIGDESTPFTNAQYDALAELLIEESNKNYRLTGKEIPLDALHVTGHSNIALPAGRKKDPGPMFKWADLFDEIYNKSLKRV